MLKIESKKFDSFILLTIIQSKYDFSNIYFCCKPLSIHLIQYFRNFTNFFFNEFCNETSLLKKISKNLLGRKNPNRSIRNKFQAKPICTHQQHEITGKACGRLYRAYICMERTGFFDDIT